MVKLYLAGAAPARRRLGALATELRQAGHELTHDWMAVDVTSPEEAIQSAKSKADAVIAADVLLAVMDIDDYSYHSTRHEIGVALGANALAEELGLKRQIEIWIVNSVGDVRGLSVGERPPCMRCSFELRGDRYFQTTDEVFAALEK